MMKLTFEGEDILFVIWVILLLPWLPFFLASGMAFDGGPTLRAYVFVGSLWTYPVSVVIVANFRQQKPLLALLPVLNIIGVFSDLLWKSN